MAMHSTVYSIATQLIWLHLKAPTWRIYSKKKYHHTMLKSAEDLCSKFQVGQQPCYGSHNNISFDWVCPWPWNHHHHLVISLSPILDQRFWQKLTLCWKWAQVWTPEGDHIHNKLLFSSFLTGSPVWHTYTMHQNGIIREILYNLHPLQRTQTPPLEEHHSTRSQITSYISKNL